MKQPPTILKTNIAEDAWKPLKKFTNARIAIGRAGNAVPLAEDLQFRADHAQARDAVFAELNVEQLTAGLSQFNLPIIYLQSRAGNRQEYLKRPDKGRTLNDESIKKLTAEKKIDISFIIADGLSPRAVNLYTQPVLQYLLSMCNDARFSIAPICIVQQGRVAIGDETGMLLGASLSVVFIGERPGLSSPHSMGLYISYNPVIGLTDESRYCISNIHTHGGLSPQEAATQAFTLIQNAFDLKLSGVNAKKQRQLPKE